MKKKFLSIIAVVCIIPLSVIISGCGGESFDPCAYLNGTMTLLQTGEVTEDALQNTAATREEMEEEYAEVSEAFADEIFDTAEELGFEDNEKNRALVKKAFSAMMESTKYKVADEYTKTDNGYTVDVTIEGSRIFDEDILSGWTDDWIAENASKYSSTDAAFEAFWPAYLNYIIENADDVGNADPVTISVKIEENDDGLYEIDDDSVEEITKAMFGE